MKRLILLLSLMLSFIVFTNAQDTIKILQYNLLYYGDTTDFCTATNNNIAQKTEYLKTLINYVKPDIFGVNEINSLDLVHDYLLNNVFILNGYTTFKRSRVIGTPGYITTQVFYNSAKLKEKAVYTISAYPRPLIVHKFYLNTRSLPNGDTTWLYVIEAHLKAGSYDDDEQDRANATSNLMAFVQDYGINNYIVMGDFNLYSSSEQAYINLTSPTDDNYKFYDPAPAGNWHDNSTYAAYQTQSTNYYGDDCKVGGGLDDRFDFILYSKPLYDNTMGLKALASSFKIIGNDGNHFNDAVDYNGNTSVPDSILTVLKNNSDHLPIYMELLTSSPLSSAGKITDHSSYEPIRLNNTLASNNLSFTILDNSILLNKKLDLQIIQADGKVVYQKQINLNPKIINYNINVSQLQQGLYFINFRQGNKSYGYKFVKF